MELFKVVGLILVVQVVHATYYCEDTWKANQNNGFCYKFFPEIQGWKQARQNCTNQSGFLVSVSDENVQNFIVEHILENNFNGSVWIGGHSLYLDGWRWDNYRRNFNFSQWDSGSPVSTFRCIEMIGISGFNWSDAACEDLNAFICEKPAQLLNCDGEANIVHLEPDKLAKISFPPFYDPQQPFFFPPYEKNLTCVWNIMPPSGYRIVIDFDLLCNDDLRAFQGNTSFNNISCENSFGNYELEDLVLQLSFTSNSITKLGSEQGFQFRFFATSLKGETTCDQEGVPLRASSQKQILTSPGFPLSKSASCVWTIVSPVHGSNIYVQFRYLNISNGGELQIWNFAWPHMNSVFSRSSVLDDSRTFVYSGEKIVLNYTSHNSTSGHHGFSLVFFTDEEYVEICSQPSVTKGLTKYGIINPEDKFMTFSVNIPSNTFTIELPNSINIELVSTDGERIFVTFDSNYFFPYACIRKMNVTGACLERYDGIDLYNQKFPNLWISWFDTLKVGRGRIQGEDVIMDLRIYNPMSVNFSSVQSELDTSWNFYGSAVRSDFVEICHTSRGHSTEIYTVLWEHQLPVPGYNYLSFSVKACERAIIGFQNEDRSFIQILFDTPVREGSIVVSCISTSVSIDNIDDCISDVFFGRVLNCAEFRDFWISWGGDSGLQVGQGKIVGTNTIMKNSTKFTPFEDSFSVGNDHSDDVSFSSLWLFDRPNPKPEIINITERKVIPSPHEVESTTITMSVDINVAFEFEVKWFRDEIPVTPFSGRFLIRQSLIEVMKCSLTILQLDLQDEGLWTVRVSNNNSEAAVNFHIKVKPGIQIEILPHDGVSIQKGDTLTLVCNITNLDDLQRFSINVSLLTWYKDGIKIQEGYSQKTFTNHRSSKILQIHSVQESDRGTYTCNHERYPISGVKNVVVDIYNQEIIRITQKEALPSLHEVKGTRLTMSVYVNVRINFGVQWFRNGIIATQSSGSYTNCQPYMEVMKCSLTILQLDFQDEAVWTARASNDNSEASTNFHVKVKPGINIEIQPNNDIFIQTGNTLYLDCRITNLDDLQRFSINVSLLTWYKDDVRIQEDNSRMTVTTQRSSRSLLIYPVQESDEGIYTCNHDKYRVSGVRNVKVGVYNQDIFIMKKEVDPSLHQPVGTTLTMSVYINVRLSVEMKWFKNGVLVTESSGRFLIRQSIELTKCSLTILGLLPEDEAIWTVRISNGNSEAAATFDIKVKPGIQIEILPHDGVSLQTGDTLTLVCNITNLDDLQRFSINVSLLTWYKHGVKLQEDKSQITFTTHQSSNILRIYPVQESDKGTYTCNHDKYQISGMENVIVDVYNNDIIYIRSKEVVPSPHEVEGTSLTMSVDINIRLNFEVKWFRDGIPVTPSSGRYLIRQSFREVMKCSITILQLDLQDEATWTVRVTNNNSEAATNFYIKVKPGIKIEILPHGGVSIQTGETLTLVCNITNLEDLQFSINVSLLTWYKDDIKLPEENYRVTTMTHRSSKILQIHSVQESDRGTYSCNHKRYPISGVKKVVVDIYRLIENLCPSSMDVYGIFWPTSFPGTLVHSECIESKQGKASRYCDYDGTWKETNVSNCEDEDLSNALKELQNLENEGIVDKEYIGKIFDNSLGVTENITATRSGISSENLLACINILNIILNIVTRSNASLPERDLYSIMDNILAIYNKESWKIIEDETQVGSDSIFKIMDRMNFLLMNESQPVTFTGENIVVHINNVSLKDTDLRFLENDSFFVLPKQGRDTFQVTYYAAVLYKTMSQLLPNRIHHVSGSKSDIVINSVILALTLEHPVLPLSPPLELTFQHMRTGLSEANCVFWNYSISNNSGGWSTEGCSMNSTENGVSVCVCNHTTNFAVLMRPYTPEKEDPALVVISIVGCVLSMIFSLLTAAVFISNWKDIKSDKNVLIVILCVSLFLVYLTLLAGIDNAQNEATCVVVTFFLHFFLLFTFLLMLGVGLYYCMNVTVLFYAMAITNRFNSRSRLKLILGTTTCISLVIVFITLGSCWETQYHAEKFCWLSVSSGAIYAFIVPVILIFLLNIFIIASLLRVMFLTTKMKKAEFKEKVRNALKSVCTLVPVLGITWIFGIFAINEDLVAFQYIFTIANSIQGLLIFITQVLLNKKIRTALQVKYPFLKRKRDTTTAKEKYQKIVSSTGSENTMSNTRTGITNSSYVDNKDAKEFKSTIQLQAERKNSLTPYGNKDSDNYTQEISTETRVMKKLLVETEKRWENDTHLRSDEKYLSTDNKSSIIESNVYSTSVKNRVPEVKSENEEQLQTVTKETNVRTINLQMDDEDFCHIATTEKQHGYNKVLEENDIQIETDGKHMRTVKKQTLIENPVSLTSVDTQGLESLIVGETDKINKTEPEVRTTKFGSTLSSTDSLTRGSKQTDLKWSGGEIESKPTVLPRGQKPPAGIRLSNSVRARQRKMAQFSIEKNFMQK